MTVNKTLLAQIQSIQNSAPLKSPLTAELVKAHTRIKQLETENAALRHRPLAVTPAKSSAAQILALPQAARNKLPAAQIKAAHQSCTDKELRLKFYQQNKTILLS